MGPHWPTVAKHFGQAFALIAIGVTFVAVSFYFGGAVAKWIGVALVVVGAVLAPFSGYRDRPSPSSNFVRLARMSTVKSAGDDFWEKQRRWERRLRPPFIMLAIVGPGLVLMLLGEYLPAVIAGSVAAVTIAVAHGPTGRS